MYPPLHLMTIHPSLRILMLAGMGLAALYMMHLLAQDFNRIRRPIANVVRGLISKRDLEAVTQQDKVMVSVVYSIAFIVCTFLGGNYMSIWCPEHSIVSANMLIIYTAADMQGVYAPIINNYCNYIAIMSYTYQLDAMLIRYD